MSDSDEPQKNVNVKVKKAEWLEAEQYFKNNPDEVKFQKKFTAGGKAAGHSFVKIGDDIFALNNTSHITHESDAGVGGFGRVKRGINKDGRRIALKVEGKEKKEQYGGDAAEVKYVDDLMKDMGYMLGRVEREVREGEKGIVKAMEHYQAGTKILTAFEDRGNRDLFDEIVNNQDEYTRPPKNLMYGLRAMMAVQALHGLNIIHKDIKLENFVVNGEGKSLTVMPIDFDLSQKLKPDQTHIINVDDKGQPVVRGTPDILAPEIKTQGKYSYATDVYALGVMLDSLLLPEELCKKMMATNEKDRISLPGAMESLVKELKKPEYAKNSEVQQLLKQYENFIVKDFKIVASLSSKKDNPSEQMASALAYANKLPKKELLEYTKNVMQTAVDIENAKQPPAIPNVPNLFRSSGSGDFYVAVTQLLLKKYGFPSESFMRSIATQLKEISKEYQKFKDSGEAKAQAEKKAEGLQFKDMNEKSTFIFAEEKAILERKLHELSAGMKAEIVSEFQSKAGPILPVFDPIRSAVGATEKQQQDYMMAVFAGFCTLPLGKNPDIIKNDTSKIFSQLFSVIEEKNAAAVENKKLLQPLKEIVNASEVQRAQVFVQQKEQRVQQIQSQRSLFSKIGDAVTAFFANDFSTRAATAAYGGEAYVKKPRPERANFREALDGLTLQGQKLGLNKQEQKAWRNYVVGPVLLQASVDPKISPTELNQLISRQLDKFVAKVTYDPEADLRKAKRGGLNVEVVTLSDAQRMRNAEIKKEVNEFKAQLLPAKPENIIESQMAKELSTKLNVGISNPNVNSSMSIVDIRTPSAIDFSGNPIRVAADTSQTILLEIKSTLKAFEGQGLEQLGVHIRLGNNTQSPQAAVKVMLDSIEKVKKEKPNIEADNPVLGVLANKLQDYKARLDKLEPPKAQELNKEPAKPIIGRYRGNNKL